MYKYCHLCGSSCEDGKQQPSVCSGCGNKYFNNPSPTVDLALFNEAGEILISERGVEPNKGKFDLPGGFLELGESAEEGLYREAFEELELEVGNFTKPIFVGSYPTTYSFSKESRQILIFVFAAKLLTTKEITPHDDVASTQFVPITELGDVDFSLPEFHPSIIKKAYEALSL